MNALFFFSFVFFFRNDSQAIEWDKIRSSLQWIISGIEIVQMVAILDWTMKESC